MSAKVQKSKNEVRQSNHKIVSRAQWLVERKKLLKAEKEQTRLSDKLALRRQELPWVRIDKKYVFDTDKGKAPLADLFCGRSQLLIYHFMFGTDYDAGCPHCSAIADGFNGFAVHLANHDVTLGAVSRAPLKKLQKYKRRMGWTFPWASSQGNDFNSDFEVGYSDKELRSGKARYNFGDMKWPPRPFGKEGELGDLAAGAGTDWPRFTRESPGMSAFVLEDGVVYHTYSAFARGLDGLWGLYQWLDRAPRGRNETGLWMRRRDEYGVDSHKCGSCCKG